MNMQNKKLTSMTLGTVQLGMNYGIANDGGMPDEEKSFSMLRAALSGGAASLDTARNYGQSEVVLGKFLKTWEGEMPYITTKIRLANDPACDIEKHVFCSIEESLTRLGISKADCVLVHSPIDMIHHEEKLAAAMGRLVDLGYTDRVGVSIYTGEEVEQMLRYPQYTATQIPMSVFDQRLIASGLTKKLRDADYTVFVRSVFLQGLFFLDPDKITDPILLEHAADKIRLLRELAEKENMSIAQLAIAFMRDAVGVSSLVLGADTAEQVEQNLSYFSTPGLSSDTVAYLEESFSDVNIPEIMKVLSRPKPQTK